MTGGSWRAGGDLFPSKRERVTLKPLSTCRAKIKLRWTIIMIESLTTPLEVLFLGSWDSDTEGFTVVIDRTHFLRLDLTSDQKGTTFHIRVIGTALWRRLCSRIIYYSFGYNVSQSLGSEQLFSSDRTTARDFFLHSEGNIIFIIALRLMAYEKLRTGRLFPLGLMPRKNPWIWAWIMLVFMQQSERENMFIFIASKADRSTSLIIIGTMICMRFYSNI